MEDLNQPQFTIGELLKALEVNRLEQIEADGRVFDVCRKISRMIHDRDIDTARGELGWLTLELKNREFLVSRIERAERAVRVLNKFTVTFK